MGNLNKLKNFFSPSDENDELLEEYSPEEVVEEEEEINEDKISQFRPRFWSSTDAVKKNEVNTESKETKVLIYEPKSYSEATSIVNSLKNKRIVVINFSSMEVSKGMSLHHSKKELFDFINGAVYAMEGTIKKISTDVFVVSPPGIDIDTNIRQEVEKKGAHRWAI